MAASAASERYLRSAISALAGQSPNDIEAIWGALSDEERDQLRPLLAEAASVVFGTTLSFISTSATPTLESDNDTGNISIVPALVQLVGHWPDALVTRALEQLDDAQGAHFFALLPVERHPAFLSRPPRRILTSRARTALLNAVRHDANAIPAVNDEVPSVPDAPPTWRNRFFRRLRIGKKA